MCRLWGPSRLVLAAAVAATVAWPRGEASAQLGGERFKSTEWRVRLVAPRKWKVSQQISYPNVLLWMTRQKPDGKMLFAAEKIQVGTSARQYAKKTEQLLGKLGFRVRPAQEHPSGAFWIEFNNGKVFLQQAFLVNGDIGYTLTLAADNERQLRLHGRAYDATLRSIARTRAATAPRRANSAPTRGKPAPAPRSGAPR